MSHTPHSAEIVAQSYEVRHAPRAEHRPGRGRGGNSQPLHLRDRGGRGGNAVTAHPDSTGYVLLTADGDVHSVGRPADRQGRAPDRGRRLVAEELARTHSGSVSVRGAEQLSPS
ncbi:hypothetical protein CZ774_10815 [Frigoribacterium sp. JB110]|nr:hypothetical protein CZ774_10815 [Frigoribacterium sp. JB110]